MFNQFSIIFTIYYIIFIIHVYQHHYYYDLLFDIHQPKLVSFFRNSSYTVVVTLADVIYYFRNTTIKSHVTKLINFRDLPEAFQHARIARKNTNDYYHISQPYQGYDALSFDPNNLKKIEIEQDMNLLMLHEKKMTKSLKFSNKKVASFFKKYSLPKMDGDGIRPDPVDRLEVGFYSTEGYNNAVNDIDLSVYNKPSIIFEDYSNIYPKLVYNSHHGRLDDGTLITNSAFEELKWFIYRLGKDEEMCLHLNYLLENNPNFPIIM